MNKSKPLTRRRVLVVDDNEAILADFQKILADAKQPSSLAAAKAALFGSPTVPLADPGSRPEFEVDGALQGEDGLRKVEAALREGRPYQVAFVDMRMPPGWDGLETIKHIWQVDADIQVVICTAYSDYSLDQIIDHLGCSDRLLLLKKPFDNVEIIQLAAALSEKWRLKREATRRTEELERMVLQRTSEIEHALLHDKLTGLPNRTLFSERLSIAILRHKRHPERKFAILFLDFDRFKIINDSLGHDMGDLLLVESAQRLRESLRSSDAVSRTTTPARLGGDEFIVLIEDFNELHDVARIAERLLKTLSEPYVLNGQKVHITASVGIATSDRGYERAADMIRDADTAMYRAKTGGRARYVMFDQNMHEEVRVRLAMESSLRRAVQKSELTLHYQPIFRLHDRRLVGFEALLRWNHPERGPITAAELIPVAEDTGLIVPLGLWVLSEACRQLATWRSAYPEAAKLVMSINLSRRQLTDADLIVQVGRIIQQHGIDPRNLVLEITESSMLDKPAGAIESLDRLRAMGLSLYLDDFGTGYSSLSCLHQFPLQGIKIDRAFIHHLRDRREYTAVFQAIVAMAKAFDLRLVAEGVETDEQLELLRSLDCEFVQGFLLGPPTDSSAAENVIRKFTACPVLA